VFYRRQAAQQYSDDFVAEMQKPDPAENRYDEEKALLGFFTSALSAVESFYFCAYFAGWLVSPAFFKHVANPNRITVERAAQAFSKAFPSDPFPMQMASLQNDSQFREIEEVRNVLAHRVLPGRIRHLSM